MTQMRILLAAVLAFGLGTSSSVAQEGAFCGQLTRIIEAAPREFRALKGEEYSTKFESWRARVTVSGFDSCWIDDVRHGFWCLNQAPTLDVATRLGAQIIDAVTSCHPVVRRQTLVETMDNDLTRATTEWTLEEARRIRVVERKSTSGRGIASVFFYVY